MHSMDSVKPPKGKTFKRRAHRPWNTMLLENTLEAIAEENRGLEAELEVPLEINPNEELPNILVEKTKERDEIHEQLNIQEESRLSIGGFLRPSNIFNEIEKPAQANYLMNQLKNKEQEILSLSHDLKVAKALEQVEKLEMARGKEEEARKLAETKALFAIQEAKIAAEQVYKIEQELNVEKQLRVKEEKTRKRLEEKNQLILQEIAKKEQALLKIEETVQQTVELANSREEQIKIEAQEKIQKIVQEMSQQIEKYQEAAEKTHHQAEERISILQKEANERIKLLQKQADDKMAHLQLEVNRKIEEAKKQIEYHERSKVSIQNVAQKNVEAIRQIQADKRELEKELQIVKQAVKETQTRLEAKVENLLAQIHQYEQEKTALEHEMDNVEKKLFQSVNHIKLMESIVENEKSLRKVLEEKLKVNPIRLDEQKRKVSENKILELTKYIAGIEIEKSRVEEKLAETAENLNQLQIILGSERTVRSTLELQLKESIEKIYNLEGLKQKEIDIKQLIEKKNLLLLEQKQHLEQEKLQNQEKTNNLVEQVKQLEVMLESERYLRKEAERLKFLEEQARKAAQEKISQAIEQANRTVLSVLGGQSRIGLSNEGV